MDVTTEALIEILAENDDGVLMKRDELAGFFGSFDAYRSGSNKDESFYNEAFDGQYAKVNRKSSDKKVLAAKHTYCSITGGIQPDTFKAILKTHPGFLYSGLMARLLFSMPPDRVRNFSEASISEPAREAYTLFSCYYIGNHIPTKNTLRPHRLDMLFSV